MGANHSSIKWTQNDLRLPLQSGGYTCVSGTAEITGGKTHEYNMEDVGSDPYATLNPKIVDAMRRSSLQPRTLVIIATILARSPRDFPLDLFEKFAGDDEVVIVRDKFNIPVTKFRRLALVNTTLALSYPG